jgi:hypothetical protein
MGAANWPRRIEVSGCGSEEKRTRFPHRWSIVRLFPLGATRLRLDLPGHSLRTIFPDNLSRQSLQTEDISGRCLLDQLISIQPQIEHTNSQKWLRLVSGDEGLERKSSARRLLSRGAEPDRWTGSLSRIVELGLMTRRQTAERGKARVWRRICPRLSIQ